jgi:hypothetical protein
MSKLYRSQKPLATIGTKKVWNFCKKNTGAKTVEISTILAPFAISLKNFF